MSSQWVAIDILSGMVIADFPYFTPGGSVRATMMAYETMSGSFTVDRAPEAWRDAIRIGASAFVLLRDDITPGQTVPIWGGIVMGNDIDVGSGVVGVSLVTYEAYLKRRFIDDESYVATPQNTIVTDLVNTYIKDGSLPGLPIRVQLIGGAGEARDKEYSFNDSKTVFDALDELSSLDGGPEWYIGWESDDTLFKPVFYVGDRLGTVTANGLNPGVTFSLPGSITSAKISSSYDSSSGANRVTAFGANDGDTRWTSFPVESDDGFVGRPVYEYQWTPDSKETSDTQLYYHALRAVNIMKDGSVSLAFTANRDESPKVVRDWNLGDEVGIDITSTEFPDGLSGVGRVIGWEEDESTVSATLDIISIEGV